MPKPEPPIVMTTNVSISGFRDRSCNERRIDAAIRLIQFARQNFIDCVCFPAGYLITERTLGIPRLVKPIFDQARLAKVSFVLGVDLLEILHPRFSSADSPAMCRAVKANRVPCFLAVFSAEKKIFQIVRQRSCTSSQSIPDTTLKETRFMPLGASGFQIVLCGEVYDKRLFDVDRPCAAVVFAHTNMPRETRSLRSRSSLGFSIANTEHRSGRNGMMFCFDRGQDLSVVSRPCPVNKDKGFGIDMATWELDGQGHFKASSRFPGSAASIDT